MALTKHGFETKFGLKRERTVEREEQKERRRGRGREEEEKKR